MLRNIKYKNVRQESAGSVSNFFNWNYNFRQEYEKGDVYFVLHVTFSSRQTADVKGGSLLLWKEKNTRSAPFMNNLEGRSWHASCQTLGQF